jgi:hypothetical protein
MNGTVSRARLGINCWFPAFDAHLIGIDPDYRIHVSDRLLEIRDGPFIELGLKGIAGTSMTGRNGLKIVPIATDWRYGSSNSRTPHRLNRTVDTGVGQFPVDDTARLVVLYPEERRENIRLEMVPLYATRIEDLRPSDFVKIDCAACSHTALLTPASLARLGLEPRQRVLDLKDRVRCQKCNVRGRAVVAIKWAKDAS